MKRVSSRLTGVLGVVLGAALATTAGAAPAAAETLVDALTTAYQSNPTLLAQRAALRATDEEVPRALSGWRPTVIFTGEAGKSQNENSSSFFTSVETRTPEQVTLDITQPLFSGGRTVNDVRRSENLVLADRARLADTEQQVFLDVVTVFMNVLREKAVLDLAINNEQRLRRRLQSTRDRFEVGEVTRTDVAQAISRLSVATAERVSAEGDLTAARAAYLNVVGILPQSLSWPKAMGGLPKSDLDGRRIAAAENPALHRAVFTERAARNDVDLAIGVLLPSLDLDASLRHANDTASQGSISKSAELVARLTLPLYQSGAEHARVRQARQVASQRRIEVEESRRQVLETVTQRWQELQTARARTTAFKAAVKAAKTALDGVSQEAMVGTRTVLDVLDAENELFQAKSDLVRARRDAIVASYALRAAIGRLTADAVGIKGARYDPTAHYRAVRGKFFGIGADTIK